MALCKFCAVFGIKPMAKSVYQKKQAKAVGMIVVSGENSLKQTVERVKTAHRDLDSRTFHALRSNKTRILIFGMYYVRTTSSKCT